MRETMLDRPRRPLIIARGGASADAPEHTIAAFELALAHGADGLELDVHLSRDDQPVVIHDFTLERTTNGAGPVSEHSVRDLKRLDAGGWHGRSFLGQRLQTLQEVFERFRGRTRFWVTLRGGTDLYHDIEERVVSTIQIYDLLGETLVQSLDRQSLDQMRLMSDEIRLGLVIAHAPLDPIPGHAETALNAISTDASLVTEQAAAAIHRANLECYAWVHDEPALVDRLVEWRISGIVTNQPGPLRACLDLRPRDATWVDTSPA